MILIKLILYFAVIIGVLYLAYYVTKIIGRTAGVRQASSNMKVLERVSVGRDSFLLIVKVQDKIILLGVTPGGIHKLEELPEYDESAYEPPEEFSAVLAKQIKSNLKSMKNRNEGRRKDKR